VQVEAAEREDLKEPQEEVLVSRAREEKGSSVE
jgi:hypothetical protein